MDMKVKDICSLQNGRAFKPDDWGTAGLPIIRIQNLNDEEAPFNYYAGDYSPVHEVNDGELLFSWSGTPGTSFGAFRWYRGKGVLNQHIFRVIPKINVDKEYLKYALNGNIATIISKAHGGVGLQHITKKELDEIEIPIVPEQKQKGIVAVLQKAEKIITLRKKELQKLDDLIKARFVEMFGDPMINPKGYPIKPISELFDVGSSKRVFESEWREAGIPFYRAREIVKLAKDGFVKNELFIEEDLYEKYKAKYGIPKPGDIMVTGVGTLGVCYIVQPHDKFYFKDGNTLWFKNKGLCSERFIVEQYSTDFVRGQIEANANVSTVGTYTITNANNTRVLVPSIEEQLKFNAFVAQVDKSKAVVQKALDEAQVLSDSLMQQYFG